MLLAFKLSFLLPLRIVYNIQIKKHATDMASSDTSLSLTDTYFGEHWFHCGGLYTNISFRDSVPQLLCEKSESFAEQTHLLWEQTWEVSRWRNGLYRALGIFFPFAWTLTQQPESDTFTIITL